VCGGNGSGRAVMFVTPCGMRRRLLTITRSARRKHHCPSQPNPSQRNFCSAPLCASMTNVKRQKHRRTATNVVRTIEGFCVNTVCGRSRRRPRTVFKMLSRYRKSGERALSSNSRRVAENARARARFLRCVSHVIHTRSISALQHATTWTANTGKYCYCDGSSHCFYCDGITLQR
jgi:hypothetical protein